jgi:hypothetical protein
VVATGKQPIYSHLMAASSIKSLSSPVDVNHIDFALGTNYGEKLELDNVIDAVVAFANGDVSPNPDLHIPDVADGEGLYLVNDPNGRGLAKTKDRSLWIEQFLDRVQKQRDYASNVLRLAASGPAPLTEYLLNLRDIDEEVDVALYPVVTKSSANRIGLSWRISGPMDNKHWANFAAVLIMDGVTGSDTTVGQCHLKSCGRFFRIRAIGQGRPNRKYCRTEHMEIAHKSGSTERSQIARKKKKEAAMNLARRSRRHK